MTLNLDEAVKELYGIRDEREYQYRCVTKAAERSGELGAYRERIKREIEATEMAIIFLRSERDKNAPKKG